MQKKSKRIFSIIISIVLILVGMLEASGANVVYAQVTQVSDIASLLEVVAQCNNGAAASIQLESNITGITESIDITGGDLSIDLNGYTISGNINSNINGNNDGFVIRSSNGKLTIKDSKNTGYIKNVSSTGGVISKSNGQLNLEGGKYEGILQCIRIAESTVTIAGGSYTTSSTNGFTLNILDNNILTISGDNTSFTSCYGTIFEALDKVGNEITIENGNFTYRSDNNSPGYACYFEGKGRLNIKGGTFINEYQGSAVYIGSNMKDADVSISGGTYKGRISRGVENDDNRNFHAFYGKDSVNNGIISKGYVLTDNSFATQGKMVFTKNELEVLRGALIQLDTGRSTLETYTFSEKAEADNADYYSFGPISVDTNGTMYPNNFDESTIKTNTKRITNGNKYEFVGWYDVNGREYSSIKEYVNNIGSKDVILYAKWDAQVYTVDGMINAIENNKAVKTIKLNNNISLTKSLKNGQNGQIMSRILNFNNKTVEFNGTGQTNAAVVLDGKWNIKDGKIVSSRQACICINGTATIENIDCIAKDYGYAVEFTSITNNSANKIISGLFETNKTGSSVIKTTNKTGTASSNDITKLFQNSNASTKKVKTNGANAYLDTRKLIVSKTPITYIENGKDIEMGTYTYGDSIPSLNLNISNENYVGDIIINSITVDNKVFSAKGDSMPKTLIGGSKDLYNYSIYIVGAPSVGINEGNIAINYTKMDGETGAYHHKVKFIMNNKENDNIISKEDLPEDNDSPVILGITDKEIYYSDEIKVLVSDTNLEYVTVNGKKMDIYGNSTEFVLTTDLNKYVIEAKDKAGNMVSYTVFVFEPWVQQGITNNGTKKLFSGQSYKLGSGQWMVTGDETVYNGNLDFYVTDDGEYDFQKQ